jgi:hypothetical protein
MTVLRLMAVYLFALTMALSLQAVPANAADGAGSSVSGEMTAQDVASAPDYNNSAIANSASSSTGVSESTADISMPVANASSADPSTSASALPDAPQARLKGYKRPTEKVKLVNYLFDAYGPFPLVGAAFVAGINQADNGVPDWGQGIKGYGRRWGSNYGIGAITTTTRYGMAEILREDTLYYRCECTGFFPRLGHALISTFTGRRGEDGHRVFSVPSLVAPYVGEMVAVYSWYPGRYDAKDAFRQGNYSLLAYAGGNVALEFFPSGPHSLLSKMHLQNRHAAPENSN